MSDFPEEAPPVKAATEPRWLKWLHRVGYLTTALVIAGLCWMGVSGLFRESTEEQAGSPYRLDSTDESVMRTVLGSRRPLQSGAFDDQDDMASEAFRDRFDVLPALSRLGESGFRFVIDPSFGTHIYALAISFGSGMSKPEGILVITENRPEGWNARSETFHFELDRSEFAILMTDVDALIRDWSGDLVSCIDGSPLAFERKSAGGVWRGTGNCDARDTVLAQLMLQVVQRHVDSDLVPTENDWHRPEAGESDDPSN